MSWGEREDVGETDGGKDVVRDENGDHWTIDNSGPGGLPEANHASTDAEIEEAERNG